MSARHKKIVDISQRLLPFQQAITMPTHKTYCVYTHAYHGEVFYVGKGRSDRPFQQVGRNSRWHAFVREIHAYEISIVLWTDDEAHAFAEEARLIAQLLPVCNGVRSRNNGYYLNDEEFTQLLCLVYDFMLPHRCGSGDNLTSPP